MKKINKLRNDENRGRESRNTRGRRERGKHREDGLISLDRAVAKW